MGMDEVWAEDEELKDSVLALIKKVSELESMNASLYAKCQMLQQEISSLKVQNNMQSGSSITQWEYKELFNKDVNEKKLNELGKEGWETAVVKPIGTVILKRPKEKKESSQGYGR